jgi:transposase
VRPPEVFVRVLEIEEARRLKRLATDARHRSTRIRAMILLASATEMPAPQIARLYLTDADHVRKVIHEFNARGFGSLDPDYRGGRPRKTTPEQRDSVVAVARARPDTQGVALTRWSIAKLARYLAEQQIVALSPTSVRTVLDQAGLSFQRTRSWKTSPDPEFAPKAERILALYRNPPADGPVVCFDEMGPIQLIPHHGAGWAPIGAAGAAARDLQPPRRDALSVRCLRRPRRSPTWPPARPQGRARRARVPAHDQDALPAATAHPPDHGQPLHPLDTGDSQVGGRQQHGPGSHADLCQLPQPHRVPVLGDRRVRDQERRLPRLGHARPRHGRLHPSPQPHPRRRADRAHRSPRRVA